MKDMILTEEMESVMKMVQETTNNIFITGKAGSGKTTFLKYLIKNCKKKCIVAAPTGVAAINAGGVTLHSLFHINFGPISPVGKMNKKFNENKTEMLNELELLIIDEISMVRADIMDSVDRTLRWVRECEEPFGGVQVVMFGDLFQLPPVIKKEDTDILGEFYDDYFFFNALVFKKTGFHVTELMHIFRQTDEKFVEILNNIREYKATSDNIKELNKLKDKYVVDNDDSYIHICTHKNKVESMNKEKLGEEDIVEFKASITGKFTESSVPCDTNLKLRVGARVMALTNDSFKGYYNGMLGVVKKIDKRAVHVKMDNGLYVKFEPHTWKNIEYKLKDGDIVEEEIGSCSQIPLSLAWAITIHKSQGLTFDKVALYISRTFCPGQLYVALSRCTNMEGIVIDSYIRQRMIIPEYSLIDFERAYKCDNNYFGKHLDF